MVNAVVLNYARPFNMKAVIDGLKMQTVEKRIIVFDAGGNFQEEADIVIRTRTNFGCLPRFYVPGWLKSEYVFQSDDDHAITDPHLFERLIEESDLYPTSALCYNGRILEQGNQSYQGGTEVSEPKECSVCNFGFSFYPSWIMNGLPVAPYSFDEKKITEAEMKYADDLWVSSFVTCRVSEFIRPSLKKLDEGSDLHTLSKNSKHMDARNAIGERFFLSRGIT